MKILTNVDLSRNQVQNVVLHPLAAAPSNPAEGQLYYNSADKMVYQYNGEDWVPIGELNVIEEIKVNNAKLTPTNKTVNITVPTNTNELMNGAGYIKADEAPVQSVAGRTGEVTLAKGDVGLGNVDNTSDTDKPVSTAQQQALDAKLSLAGGTMTGVLAMGNHKITGLADGTADGDAVTVKQLNDAKVGALKPSGSIAFADLPALGANVLNNIYNITNAFNTTADFVEGAGKSYGAGTNVAIINVGTEESPVYKYDAYTGVIDTSDFMRKSGLLGTTGQATDNTMTQKAITDELGKKQNTLTFDSEPKSGSTNPVTSGGVYTALSERLAVETTTIAAGSTNGSIAIPSGYVLVDVRTTSSGERVVTEVTEGANAVSFSLAQAYAAAVTCTAVFAKTYA